MLDAGGKTCPPTIVGVGVGGTADLCVHLAKRAATRPLGTPCADPQGAALERELSQVVNMLGVGPQGLGGDATAFAVHVELEQGGVQILRNKDVAHALQLTDFAGDLRGGLIILSEIGAAQLQVDRRRQSQIQHGVHHAA